MSTGPQGSDSNRFREIKTKRHSRALGYPDQPHHHHQATESFLATSIHTPGNTENISPTAHNAL